MFSKINRLLYRSPSQYFYKPNTTPHLATLLSFPSRPSCLSPTHHQTACSEIISLAAAISPFEPVRLYARPEDVPSATSMIAAKVADPTRVSIIPSLTNHLWIRDTGPVYVSDGVSDTRYAISFHFNEWGNTQYESVPDWSDAQKEENHLFAKNVIESDLHPAPVTPIDSKICLEGGALIVDGHGTLLATESSIINDNRNPGLSKGDIEDELRRLLGVRKIIWFPGRKGLDVTDVHVDAEVQFVSPGVVVVSRPHREAEQGWKDVFEEIYEILSNETDCDGRPFEIHLIDEPHPSCLGGAEEKATNYVNFYCVNGGIILPMFGDEEADQKALHTMQSLCPDRVVKQVLVKALPASGGVVHCATQPVF